MEFSFETLAIIIILWFILGGVILVLSAKNYEFAELFSENNVFLMVIYCFVAMACWPVMERALHAVQWIHYKLDRLG